MQKLIIIKYGELTTKKDNINFFLKALKKNVEDALCNIDHTTTWILLIRSFNYYFKSFKIFII